VEAHFKAGEYGSDYFDPGFVGGGAAVCGSDMELRLLEKAGGAGSQAQALMRQLSTHVYSEAPCYLRLCL